MKEQKEALQALIATESKAVNAYIKADIEELRASMDPLLCDILEYGLLGSLYYLSFRIELENQTRR